MRYIKPEIEIAEIQAEDVITASTPIWGNIINSLTPEQESQVDFGTTEGVDSEGNPTIGGTVDIDAGFFLN
ncbi:MAG: hypothetical protein IJF11_02195 [Clostridia bacterium]|nr:hypothetical protein [Clostridia bacterium]